jgi:hypothetical protein
MIEVNSWSRLTINASAAAKAFFRSDMLARFPILLDREVLYHGRPTARALHFRAATHLV